MTLLFRITLIVGAVLTFALMLRKIRNSEVKIADATFWFIFAIVLVLLAIFPHIAFFFAGILGIESPANFIFMSLFVVLIVYAFHATVELAILRNKVTTLVQNDALIEHDFVQKVKADVETLQEEIDQQDGAYAHEATGENRAVGDQASAVDAPAAGEREAAGEKQALSN